MANQAKVCVPDIGDVSEVPIVEVLVSTGSQVAVDDILITLETDKATVDVPSSSAGVVTNILVKAGDLVSKGSEILQLTAEGAAASSDQSVEAPSSASKAEEKPVQEKPAVALPVGLSSDSVSSIPYASPSVRLLARQKNIDLATIKGSGRGGRILREDLQQPVSAKSAPQKSAAASDGEGLNLLPWPAPDFSQFGAVERVALSRVKKIGGDNLHRNWVKIPHVTNHHDADVTELEAFRKRVNAENKDGQKITMLAFLVKAVVAALKRYPVFNASLDGSDHLVLKQYYHVGIAVDAPGGLMVPVVRDADQLSITKIAAELVSLAALARDSKLSRAQMTGGCFTISSLGGIGGSYFTPIINAPEVGILGVGKASIQPVWQNEQFVPRLMMPLSLSWDHRVIDGAAAARFNAYLVSVLSDFRRIVL